MEEGPLDSAITKVLLHYFPRWTPPKANRWKWNKCLCPAHDEDRPSASVSFDLNAVNCHGCGFKGDVIAIIRRKEGCSFGEAQRRAEEILGRSYEPLPQEPARKSGRRVFGDPRPDGSKRGRQGQGVSARVRGRSAPWA